MWTDEVKNMKNNPFQVFLQVLLTDNVDDPSQIACVKHKPDIGTGSFPEPVPDKLEMQGYLHCCPENLTDSLRIIPAETC